MAEMDDVVHLDPSEAEQVARLATSLWPEVAGWSYKRLYTVVMNPTSREPQTAALISMFFPGGCFPLAEEPAPSLPDADQIRRLADKALLTLSDYYPNDDSCFHQQYLTKQEMESFTEMWDDFRVRHQGVPLNREAACVAHLSRCLQHIDGIVPPGEDDSFLCSEEQWIRFWSPGMLDVRETLVWLFKLSITPWDQSEAVKALQAEGAAAVDLVLDILSDMGLSPVLIRSNPVAIRHGCAQCKVRISNRAPSGFDEVDGQVPDSLYIPQGPNLCTTIENQLCDAQTLTDPVLTEFAVSEPVQVQGLDQVTMLVVLTGSAGQYSDACCLS